MIRSQNYKSASFRANVNVSNAEHFLDEDFNQDDLSGRYGNSRDRQVHSKLREARSKPRRRSSETQTH